MILDKIKNDWIAARKAQDRIRATLLGTLVGSITTKEKTFNPARSLTEAEVLGEVKKMLDGVIETGKHLRGSGRDDQIAHNAIEQTVLEAYMPAQMSEAEIEQFAVAKKADGMNMGAIMAALKSEFPGKYDGKAASGIVKRVLV